MPLEVLYLFNTFAARSEVFDKYVLAAAFLLFLYVSAYARRTKLHIVLTTIIATIVAREGIVPIVRFLYYRPWPFHAYQLRQLVSENAWSFPSGHSAFLIAVAATAYIYDKKWSIVFFIYAIVMIVLRNIAGIYHPLDSLGGVIIAE